MSSAPELWNAFVKLVPLPGNTMFEPSEEFAWAIMVAYAIDPDEFRVKVERCAASYGVEVENIMEIFRVYDTTSEEDMGPPMREFIDGLSVYGDADFFMLIKAVDDDELDDNEVDDDEVDEIDDDPAREADE